MKFTTSIIALCIAFASVEASDLKYCNADGCLRALLPTRDLSRFEAGAAFCATYLAAIPPRTDISGAPPTATKSCGSSPQRYSSACTCIPPLPTPVVKEAAS
ncbi:hypothetical protein NA56DRAFT_754304 [Hyaloscypha hepaticicola]|uniref:Fungal calcium binding protein domain-containing protein n=1 Tax=Hyaloscypha hepaticicola TaxID=2082293 RepID=A0A2J6PM27_9HELO|nr:hypothetical protein NA56DRAFT_754304 [Hyaloscypha hepaticicola]